MNFLCEDYRVSYTFSCVFSTSPCSFCSSTGSIMMDLMMQLLIISASHGVCGSDVVEHSRHDGVHVSYCRK